MPAPIPLPLRRLILRRHQQGHSPSDIAGDLGVSVRSVHLLARRFAQLGQQALIPCYRTVAPPPPPLVDVALDLRRLHPPWGAGLIRARLLRDHPDQPPPCTRTLQRHFARAGLAPARPGRKPLPRRRRADQPHLVWQMDAAEEVLLGCGQKVSWLRLTDECSGAFLQTTVFAQAKFNQVAPAAVQQALRRTLAAWGLPGWMRVDNGFPWGSAGDLPTDLALWMIGLGVQLWWNNPGCPQENGVVERSQGTGKRWGEPHTCQSASELQRRIDELDELQRCFYDYREGKSRMGWYPGLLHSGRRYDEASEEGLWQWQRVAEHLGGYCVRRKVDEKGQIWIYNRHYYAGKRYAREHLLVEFNEAKRCWVALTESGAVVREIQATELSAERVRGLDVTHRRDRSGRGATPAP
jgi:hypothetical protein